MTAIEIHDQLQDLQAERALASLMRLDEEAYLADLDEEITSMRAAYVAAAVTEVATLRAELFGAQLG